MIEERLSLRWFCQSRADIMTEELLELMKKAGCTTIQFGIESTSPKLLEKYGKNSKIDKVQKAIQICKKVGIRTLASIIIGLPGDSSDAIRQTVKDIITWDCDYASFNIAAPEMGTDLRQQVINNGFYQPQEDQLDSSRSEPTINSTELSIPEQWQLRNEALRNFYFRPRYLLKRLLSIRSPLELRTHMSEGLSVFKSRLTKSESKKGT